MKLVQTMETIYHKIALTNDKLSVTRALTTAEGLSSWWTDTEKTPEGNWLFHFGKDYSKEFFIEEEGNGSVRWRCLNAAADWLDTVITFDIEERNDKIVLHFKHINWKEQNEVYGMCNFHWALYLKNLKDNLES